MLFEPTWIAHSIQILFLNRFLVFPFESIPFADTVNLFYPHQIID